VILRFKDQIAKGGPVTVTHPNIIRYFMTIPEATQLVLEAGSMGNGGEIYVFDMGKPVPIVDLARKMIRLSGMVPGIDIEIKYTGLRPGEKLYEELLNDAENTQPTHHQKILIAKNAAVHISDIEIVYQRLFTLAQDASTHLEMVSLMKELVPEFISNNSVYEQLDQQKNSISFDQQGCLTAGLLTVSSFILLTVIMLSVFSCPNAGLFKNFNKILNKYIVWRP
jgi:FlaA1/EpsC-like NDP-sugar epimerase